MLRSLQAMREDFLHRKLNERRQQNAFRQLKLQKGLVDFCSNDYLGLARTPVSTQGASIHGSGGSRLLAGNYTSIEAAEQFIADFHDAEAGLIFNSGYDANLGLLSSVPQRGDTILYDYLSHASIRDGIRLSFAAAHSFAHNDMGDLEAKLQKAIGNIFVVTESVFSMDGDKAPLTELVSLCEKYGAHLVVDEAHATGIVGASGEGLVQELGLQQRCFARVHTFGKAVGCHGAIVLGSTLLRDHLVNFARSFIYTTSLPPVSVEAIQLSYQRFPYMNEGRAMLAELVRLFQEADIRYRKLASDTAIQGVVVPGNEAVKRLATSIQASGFDVRPILYPTVPANSERLRIVLHSFNTKEELEGLISLLR